MRVCLIAVEIFAWGKHGGFGRATRVIGRELAKRGVEVFAVMPRRERQAAVEELDGITVLGFDPARPWSAAKLYRECNAHIYHSCEPSLGSYFAMRTVPNRPHIATVRDPRDILDWWMEFRQPSLNRLQVLSNYVYETNPLVRRTVRRMQAVFSPAVSLREKIQKLYRLPTAPRFLPTPVEVPAEIEKASQPTVCYVARLDRRKRPEIFCELARRFPEVRFVMAGKSRDRVWEAHLQRTYGGLANLEMIGFVDQFGSSRLSELLNQSWVFVNTATREGLPNAFLEAASHGCAILSHVDPDGFASDFGYHSARDDFARGLRYLLEEGRWQEQGRRGQNHIRETFALDSAIDQHLAIYQEMVASDPGV
jgi:glycosyltransferase involved in cell wall biosynthesis